MKKWNLKWKYWVFVAIFALGYSCLLVGLIAFIWSQLSASVQAELLIAVSDNFGALFLICLVFLGGQLFLLNELFQQYIVPLYHLSEDTLIISSVNPAHRIRVKGCREIEAAAEAVNELARHVESAEDSAKQQQAQQQWGLERERDVYAGMINDLPLGLVACNDRGEVLAYNKKARDIFVPKKRGSCASAYLCSRLVMQRSIYELLPGSILDLTLEKLKHNLVFSSASKVLSFTSPGPDGQLIAVQMAPLWRSQLVLGYTLLCEEIQGPDMDAPEARILRPWPKQRLQVQELLQAIRTEEGAEPAAGIESADHAAGTAYLEVDPYLFGQLLAGLIEVVAPCRLSGPVEYWVEKASARTRLWLHWRGAAPSQESLEGWRLSPVSGSGEDHSIRVEDVLALHGSRLILPREDGGRGSVGLELQDPSRREEDLLSQELQPQDGLQFSHLELLRSNGLLEDMLDAPLSDLVYTVFDTETTGLSPQAGDEIISLSAVRIVQGSVQLQEIFNQLINPRRIVPEESIGIHGIQPEMLEGQPFIEEVLPFFQEFAKGTVLVAHNAVFDMEFLRAKEETTRVRLNNPVLDTALLSALVHPHQKDHHLENVAKRLGVKVYGRHTSLGDAMTTAEMFLKLQKPLAQKKILTLRQACSESQRISSSPELARRGLQSS